MPQRTTTTTRGASQASPAGPAEADYLRRAYLPATETRRTPAHAIDHPELDPDHHLWKNGTRWWIAITVHTRDWRKQRIRKSLGTADIREARARRDSILRFFEQSSEYDLSLRYARRTG